MVANPCSGPISRGLYGTDLGLFGKFHSTLTTAAAGQTCGFVLWFPDYSDDITLSRANIIGACATASATEPPNTSTIPAFTNAAWTLDRSFRIPDPAAEFTNSATCADMRTHAACMKMRYIGRKFDARGEVAVIQNYPVNELVTEGVSLRVPSVDSLFKSSTAVMRFGETNQEVVYQPTANSETFQSEAVTPLQVGVAASSATTSSTVGLAQNPVCFGFAWRGLDAAATPSLVFDFYKVSEWRPSPESGLTTPAPDNHGPSLREKTLAALQRAAGMSWNINPQTAHGLGVAARLAHSYYQARSNNNRLG